ncbi:MAG: hypothetical protein WCP82_08520, partial [Alphaproteobacteria bacterium]
GLIMAATGEMLALDCQHRADGGQLENKTVVGSLVKPHCDPQKEGNPQAEPWVASYDASLGGLAS